MILPGRLRDAWLRLLTRHAGLSRPGRWAARLAAADTHPFHSRASLARLHPRGFIAPGASIEHPALELGRHVYVGDGVCAFRSGGGGPIELGDEVHFYGNTMLQTGSSGRIRIGAGTHVQPGCTFSAHVGEIVVGARCEIASACSFYSYNHGIAAGREIMEQPLVSHGGIRIGDSVWLGHGVSVLDNVEIGNGAVIGAGSVVVKSIPENAIAAGVPARVIRMRS